MPGESSISLFVLITKIEKMCRHSVCAIYVQPSDAVDMRETIKHVFPFVTIFFRYSDMNLTLRGPSSTAGNPWLV
jgi:hypothetical protein